MPPSGHPYTFPGLMRLPPISVIEEIDTIKIIDAGTPPARVKIGCHPPLHPVGMPAWVTRRVRIAPRDKAIRGECQGRIARWQRVWWQRFGVRQQSIVGQKSKTSSAQAPTGLTGLRT